MITFLKYALDSRSSLRENISSKLNEIAIHIKMQYCRLSRSENNINGIVKSVEIRNSAEVKMREFCFNIFSKINRLCFAQAQRIRELRHKSQETLWNSGFPKKLYEKGVIIGGSTKPPSGGLARGIQFLFANLCFRVYSIVI